MAHRQSSIAKARKEVIGVHKLHPFEPGGRSHALGLAAKGSIHDVGVSIKVPIHSERYNIKLQPV